MDSAHFQVYRLSSSNPALLDGTVTEPLSPELEVVPRPMHLLKILYVKQNNISVKIGKDKIELTSHNA
jgi:hypothetical protein